MRAPQLIYIGFLGAVAVATAQPASAQTPCSASPAIEASLARDPSAENYNAKGEHLARHDDLDCAVPAFQKAIELDGGDWRPRFNLALAHLKQRRLDAALPHLKEIAALRPRFLDARMALGLVLADQGDMGGAEREFAAAVEIDPKSVDALYRLARVNMEQRRSKAAIGRLRRVLEIQPGNVAARLLLGLAYSNNGETEKAVAVLGELVEAHPNHFEGRFNLAAAYAKAERYPEAAEQYRLALQLDPEDHSARLGAAKALANSKRHQEVIDVTESGFETPFSEAEAFEILVVRGIAFRELGRFEQAEEALRQAAARQPRDAEVHYNLGVVLARQRKLEPARRSLERAKDLNPELRGARFELLSVLQQLGDSEAARAESALFEARKLLERTASMSKSARGRGDAYLEQGDPEAALREYRQAIRLNPRDAAPHYGVSLALARLHADPAERIEALEKAAALDPDLAQAHNDLGILHMEGGRFSEAERALRAAVAVNPQFAEAHNNLGVLYAKLGRNSEAERLFRRAAEDDPGYASAYVNHGLTLAALDRWESAEQTLRKAEKLLPDDLRVLTGLGMLFMRTNRIEEALTRLHGIAELNPRNAQAHLNVGGALTAMLDLEGALASFTRAAALEPNSSRMRYQRGRFLYDLGRHEEARAELQRAIALAPDSTEPLYLLALVEKRLGNGRAAADRLRTLIEAAPGNAAGHFQLGLIIEVLEGRDAAVPHWRNALKADPEHAEALFNLSEAPRSNDPGQAAAYRSQFEALRSRRQINSRAGLLREFALASAAARDWDRAVAQLTEALNECGVCPEQFELHKRLGLIYARSGRPNEGEKELRHAARLKAGDAEVEQALQRLEDILRVPAVGDR